MKRVTQSLIAAMTVCTVGIGAASGVALAADITEAQIVRAVMAHVEGKIQHILKQPEAMGENEQATVQVNVLQVPAAPFHFPNATQAESVKMTLESPLGDMYSNRSVVQVRMVAPDGQRREIGVPVSIVIQKPVWVLKTAVKANEPLRLSDLSLVMRDVSRSYAYAVGQEKAVAQYVARVNLMAGDVLDARKLIMPPDVRYNNDVRILLTNGDGMTVSVPGVAMADGRIGDTIRVRQSLYQRKYYSAKIIDRNQVLVEM